MKKTILLSSLFAVGAAFATTVESGNAVGALDKQISTSDANQILISVPFLGYENGGAVKVCDMVKTSNLDEGSKLYVPDDKGTYNTWTLNASGEWVADLKVTIVNFGTPGVEPSDNQANATVERGSAFWLQPKFRTGTTTDTIFLLGQGVADDGQSTAAQGWNLIGNASLKDVDLKDLEAATDDQIVVQENGALRYYTFKEGKGWRYTNGGKWVANGLVTIKPGQGLWYKPATAKTIDWSTGKAVKN